MSDGTFDNLTVFVLMLENRSFDHMFGYSGITGFDASSGLPTEVNGLVHSAGRNQDPRAGQWYTTSPTATFTMGTDVEHEFLDVMCQLCGPSAVPPDGVLHDGVYPPINNSGFVANYVQKFPTGDPQLPMRCFSPESLPVMNNLARCFAICDNWFCSHPGPTWPNRFWVHAAAGTGQADSPPDARIGIAMAGTDLFSFPNGTIYDRLVAHGLKYRIYTGDGCPQVQAIEIHTGQSRPVYKMSNFEADISDPGYDAFYTFIEPDYGVKGFWPWLFGCHSTQPNDMHPPSDIRNGEQLVNRVYMALRKSPLWQRSVLIVVFDEHGGFYDHVPPPPAVAPGDAEKDNTHNFQFNQLGGRVPALICSPLIPKGIIDHTLYDHTSILASLERLVGLQPLTARDAAANDFLHLLSLPPRQDCPMSLIGAGPCMVTGNRAGQFYEVLFGRMV